MSENPGGDPYKTPETMVMDIRKNRVETGRNLLLIGMSLVIVLSLSIAFLTLYWKGFGTAPRLGIRLALNLTLLGWTFSGSKFARGLCFFLFGMGVLASLFLVAKMDVFSTSMGLIMASVYSFFLWVLFSSEAVKAYFLDKENKKILGQSEGALKVPPMS